jgi:predicted dinucleotide-binding enzyme
MNCLAPERHPTSPGGIRWRSVLTRLVGRALLAALLLPLTAAAETIAIVGTGSVGGALGPEFAALGHTVVYGSRDPEQKKVADLVARTGRGASAGSPAEAAAAAQIVVLAVPGLLVEEITRGLGDLGGKIVIDPTNPLIWNEDGSIELAEGPSNSERIRDAAPGARVVKAFNTLNWRTMVDPGISGGPVSIPLAGDDEAAMRAVADLATGLGLEPVDVGPLTNARYLEGMAVLLLTNRLGDGPDFDFHLRRLP